MFESRLLKDFSDLGSARVEVVGKSRGFESCKSFLASLGG